MTKIIAALNLKGGSGKTSLLVNVGGVLAEQKSKVVLFDLDPQQSAWQWSRQSKKPFSYRIVKADLSQGVSVFKQQLHDIIKEEKADYALLDCPPQMAEETFLAVLISDLVLIPISASPLDLWAGQQAIVTVLKARQQRNSKLPKAALVPSKLIKGTVLSKDLLKSLKKLKEPLAPAFHQRIAIPEAVIAGTTINHYAKNSSGHKEFLALCKYIKSKLKN